MDPEQISCPGASHMACRGRGWHGQVLPAFQCHDRKAAPAVMLTCVGGLAGGSSHTVLQPSDTELGCKTKPVPAGFPCSSIGSRNLSACIPSGLGQVWVAGIPQEGWRLWSLCRSWPRQKIWANSATKTSLALQACCCSGNLKLPISNAITSWLSLLLLQGGDFVNLEKAKNTEIDFFFTRLPPNSL